MRCTDRRLILLIQERVDGLLRCKMAVCTFVAGGRGRSVVPHPPPPSPTQAALELLIYSLTSEDVSFYLIEFVLLS